MTRIAQFWSFAPIIDQPLLASLPYVAGVNRAGRDPWCDYCGRTALIDPYGRAAASCGEGEHVVTGDIDMDRLTAFRRKFPVLEDRDAWLADESWRG